MYLSVQNVHPFVLISIAGIRAWDVDLTVCDLDEQLKLFVQKHTSCQSKDVKGECRSLVSTLILYLSSLKAEHRDFGIFSNAVRNLRNAWDAHY